MVVVQVCDGKLACKSVTDKYISYDGQYKSNAGQISIKMFKVKYSLLAKYNKGNKLMMCTFYFIPCTVFVPMVLYVFYSLCEKDCQLLYKPLYVTRHVRCPLPHPEIK